MSQRLDRMLSSKGLTRSRTEAARLINQGHVQVNGVLVTKSSLSVSEDAEIEITTQQRWVSRAAQKLIAALDQFNLDVTGRTALDLGASTGGFTQVLLHRGCASVIALDVGHGQLDPIIRSDTRVTVVEGENARNLNPQRLDEIAPGQTPNLITADLSFISLKHILPTLKVAAPAAEDWVLLVKPQFEVGRNYVKGGLVTERTAAANAVLAVVSDAAALGLGVGGFAASPIKGIHGNQEFLLWLRADPECGAETKSAILKMVMEGG